MSESETVMPPLLGSLNLFFLCKSNAIMLFLLKKGIADLVKIKEAMNDIKKLKNNIHISIKQSFGIRLFIFSINQANLNLHTINIKNMKLPKNLGLLTFIFLVLISLALIALPMIRRPIGVIVTSVDAKSPCKDIMTIGSVITGVGSKLIKNSNDFTETTKGLEGVVTFIINGNPRSCNIPKGTKLNVTVTDMRREGIKLGTDVWGGTYYLFEPEEFSQDLIDSIEQRVIKYGLSNTKIEPYNKSLIKIITSPDEENYVNFLVERGGLDCRVTRMIDFDKENVEFLFNDKTYEMSLKDERTILINGSEYRVGQYFMLDDVDMMTENVSKNTTTLSIVIFRGEDLTVIQSSRLGYSRIIKQDGSYLFAVPVELSERASENFEKATKNLEVLVNPTTGESYSKSPLDIFIDDELFISIPILSSDMGTKPDNLILWGQSQSVKEATEKMVRLKTIVETKNLPKQLIFVKRDVFKSSHGEVLITSFLWIILAVSVIVPLLFFVKFRKMGVVSLPLVLLVLSEIVIIIGVVSAQWFALVIFFVGISLVLTKGGIYNWKCWVGILLFFVLIVGLTMGEWVLDAPMIVGLMATFGQIEYMIFGIVITIAVFVGRAGID